MKTFSKNDQEFICSNCGKKVSKLDYTSRDHCPFCLYSLHIDINPGDRSCQCLGLLKPIAIEKHQDNYKIVYRCLKCKMIKKNIMARDDDFDKLLEVVKNTID